MSTSTHEISVIVCAYTEERWNDLVAAAESVYRQTDPPLELIIVIDHNTKLLERVQSEFPGTAVIKNSEQQGLSGARNSGIAVAKGSIIAFLDDDAMAEPDWVMRLSQGYENGQVLGVGGSIQPVWLAKRPKWFPEEFDWIVGCTYLGLTDTAAPVRNFIGCNMSFRREVFDTVGNFRSQLGRLGKRPMGCDETELCIRAAQQWPHRILLHEPRAKVHHRVPSSRGTWRYFRERCYGEGLSKAIAVGLVGSKDGLASEWKYTIKTLPLGVLRGLADTFFRLHLAGLMRAGAIIAGLAITTAGYLKGRLAERLATRSKTEARGQSTL